MKKSCHRGMYVEIPLGTRSRSVALTTHNSFTSHLLFKLLTHTKNQSPFRLWFFSLSTRMAKHGSLRLMPLEEHLVQLNDDYRQMQEMFFEDPPSFESVLEKLKAAEEEINRIKQ